MNSIFVQIASYRDPQLLPTVKSLIDNSMRENPLHVCVCWQHVPEELRSIFDDLGLVYSYSYDYNHGDKTFQIHEYGLGSVSLTVIDVPHFKTEGACWARNLIQQFYADEDYTMQLDSHHRFVKEWDKLCIEMMETLRYKSKKPVLTTYVSSFNPENDPAERIQKPWKMDFDRFIPEGAVFFLPATIDDFMLRTEPMRARFYSGHFAFADGSFAREVQHDPEFFFHGEEISIAVRAFTHGYDLYHPHKIVAWHEYTRNGRTKVWDDHVGSAKAKGDVKLEWWERNAACHLKNRRLFAMDGESQNGHEKEFEKYGFGKERTLREYEEYAGLCFKRRGVQQETLSRQEPVYPARKYTEEEWDASFTISCDVHIAIHKSDLQMTNEVYDFWYVAAHDAEGEIFRRDLNADQIANHLKNEWTDYRFVFTAYRKPTTYVVWPHSTNKGWGQKIIKPV